MPVVTPIDAPPEPSSFVLMVSGLITMGIYFLATRKKRQAALDARNKSLHSSPASPVFENDLLQTELAIEQDLKSIQEGLSGIRTQTDEVIPAEDARTNDRKKVVVQK